MLQRKLTTLFDEFNFPDFRHDQGNGRKPSTSIDSLRHHDKRTNIATEDLRVFVFEAEEQPKVVLCNLLTSSERASQWV
jgi:hypothetical protein